MSKNVSYITASTAAYLADDYILTINDRLPYFYGLIREHAENGVYSCVYDITNPADFGDMPPDVEQQLKDYGFEITRFENQGFILISREHESGLQRGE